MRLLWRYFALLGLAMLYRSAQRFLRRRLS